MSTYVDNQTKKCPKSRILFLCRCLKNRNTLIQNVLDKGYSLEHTDNLSIMKWRLEIYSIQIAYYFLLNTKPALFIHNLTLTIQSQKPARISIIRTATYIIFCFVPVLHPDRHHPQHSIINQIIGKYITTMCI